MSLDASHHQTVMEDVFVWGLRGSEAKKSSSHKASLATTNDVLFLRSSHLSRLNWRKSH